MHDEFVEKYVDTVSRLQVEGPLDENTFMGPVVSAEHRDTAEGYVDLGIGEGAKLLYGASGR